MAATTRQQGVSDAVYRYLQAHRNVEVSVEDIAADLDLTTTQVTGSVSHMRNNWGAAVDSPRKGWYIFRGTPAKSGDIVPHKAKSEVVALVGDGRLLVSVEGVVYVARPLDLD